MNYVELMKKREVAEQTLTDSAFEKCIDCDNEQYISLSMGRHDERLVLSVSTRGLICSNDQLKQLRDVLNELFPVGMDDKLTKEDCTFKPDGKSICCMAIDAQNYPEDPAGFGDDNDAAFKDLLETRANEA